MAAIEEGIELPPLPEGFFKADTEDSEGKWRSLQRGIGWGLFCHMVGRKDALAREAERLH